MKSIAEIKKAIKQLPEHQRRELSRWLVEEQNKTWDAELNHEASRGKLQFLIDEAEAGKKTTFP